MNVVLWWCSHANVVIHFVCVCVLVTTSSVKNLSKCIPFDENGGVLFWALDLEKKVYIYISLFFNGEDSENFDSSTVLKSVIL